MSVYCDCVPISQLAENPKEFGPTSLPRLPLGQGGIECLNRYMRLCFYPRTYQKVEGCGHRRSASLLHLPLRQESRSMSQLLYVFRFPLGQAGSSMPELHDAMIICLSVNLPNT